MTPAIAASLPRFFLLQWGRGQLTADDLPRNAVPAVEPELQWGRGQLTADDSAWPAAPACGRGRLQWGRGQLTADDRLMADAYDELALASMGPRSADRG